MPGFSNDVMYAGNVRFDGAKQPGQVTTDGQILIGSTVAPNIRVGTITSTGGTITVTPGAGTIDLAAAGLTTWSVISADQAAVVGNGYFLDKAGLLSLSLPATSAIGDIIEVSNINTAAGAIFTQAANQQIFVGNTNTTLGVGGTLASTALGDTVKIVCRTANLVWQVVSMVGNWTVV